MERTLENWISKLSPYVSVRTKDEETSDAQSGRSMRSSSKTRRWNCTWSAITTFGTDNWRLEILSATVSVLAFIAIIAVLAHYDGRKLTSLPHGITLNGVVSVLATIAKPALMTVIATAIGQFRWLRFSNKQPHRLQELQVLDDASRGPRGSMMLLLNGRIRSIAIFGAILTLVSVAFDPSIQLLIHTEARSQFVGDPGAALNQVTWFTDIDYYKDGLSLSYREAVISALSDHAPSFEMIPACPSKNCTWPAYSNLRMFSKCKDITQWMYDHSDNPNTNLCTTKCAYEVSYGEGGLICSGSDQTETTCLYNMPEPFSSFSDSYSSMANTNIQRSILQSTGLPGAYLNGTEAAQLLSQDPGQMPLTISATVRIDSSSNSVADAFLCALSFKLETLNASVEDGIPSSHVLETMTLSNVESIEYPNGTIKSTMYFMPDKDNNKSNAALWINYDRWSNLNVSLSSYFTGQLSTDDSYSHEQLTWTPSAESEIAVGMHNTDDFPAMMDRVAASISQQMRNVGGNILTGQSGYMETHFRISWDWITLPTIVLAGGIIFLAITMIETKRNQAEVWKSSSLPLLYNASECDLKRDSDPRSLSQMEHLAESTAVTLERSSYTGWAFQRKSGPNQASLM